MSQQLINRSPDLLKLQNDGFDMEVKAACLLIKDVPYVNSQREIKRGILISILTLAGNMTTRPADHVAYFKGEHPCDSNGNKLEAIANSTRPCVLGDGVDADHIFSAKPMPSGYYEDYYSKINAYIDRISGPATVLEPVISAKTFPVVKPEEENSVFRYDDTASTRTETTAVSSKLRLRKIAVIGLGGTGSYVLDLVAKTPVKEIHLYDADLFLQHNAFRAPGAPSEADLQKKQFKVNYLQEIYSKMHTGIVAHPQHVTEQNIGDLNDAQMVFLCMDKGSAKQIIVERLEAFGITFIDVGMGVVLTDGKLGGMLCITTSTPSHRNHVREKRRISFTDDPQGEYNTNIQIADLNALNATLAVIKWKKLCGFYHDQGNEYHGGYMIGTNKIINEDQA